MNLIRCNTCNISISAWGFEVQYSGSDKRVPGVTHFCSKKCIHNHIYQVILGIEDQASGEYSLNIHYFDMTKAIKNYNKSKRGEV